MPLSMCDSEGKVRVKCRAVGSDGEVQHAQVEEMYNVRGLMNNSCDELNFKVTKTKE